MTSDQFGWFLQLCIVFASAYLLFSGQFAGILVLLPALLVDVILKGIGIKTSSNISNGVKVLLLIQAMMIVLMIKLQEEAKELFAKPITAQLMNNNYVNTQRMNEENGKEHHSKRRFESQNESITVSTGVSLHDLYDRAIALSSSSLSVTSSSLLYIHPKSRALLSNLFFNAPLPSTSHHDLRYRSSHEIHEALKRIFGKELPAGHALELRSTRIYTPENEENLLSRDGDSVSNKDVTVLDSTGWSSSLAAVSTSSALSSPSSRANLGFDKRFKNPCWVYDSEINTVFLGAKLPPSFSSNPAEDATMNIPSDRTSIACLPYAYILGQPKCGTSDLFERLRRHPSISGPEKKEVRWFTRGEFNSEDLEPENDEHSRRARRISPQTSLFSFTRSYDKAVNRIVANPHELITIDGGPHTLWWSTQAPDGTWHPEDIPPAQMLRELQPNARFLVVVSDPVKRLYSDYYFLADNLKPVAVNQRDGESQNEKSAAQFHERVVDQVNRFEDCVRYYSNKIMESVESEKSHEKEGSDGEIKFARNMFYNQDRHGGTVWFRASQMCAHDRHQFAVGGWGRLSIGLYVLFIEKWLEHFPPEQFLILRMEDYERDPAAYLRKAFSFLGVDDPLDWRRMLENKVFNENKLPREPLWEETEDILRRFYQPYNDLLAKVVQQEDFRWKIKYGDPTLRDHLMDSEKKKADAAGVPFHSSEGKESHHSLDDQKHLNRDADNIRNPHNPLSGQAYPDAPSQPEPSLIGSNSKGYKPNHHQASYLRGQPLNFRNDAGTQQNLHPVTLTPRSFSIDGLVGSNTTVDEAADWLLQIEAVGRQVVPESLEEAGEMLGYAVTALDLPALKYLLYDIGVPANAVNNVDYGKNAFLALGSMGMLAEGHQKSLVYSLLLGEPSWLTEHFDPPLPIKVESVHSADILTSLRPLIRAVISWLDAAGCDPLAADKFGGTLLHYSVNSGMPDLVEYALKHKVDVNAVNREMRTPLHLAASLGHAEILRSLMDNGGDLTLRDAFNVSVMDLIENPGAIQRRDAKTILGIEQRPPRTIDRVLQPELHPDEGVRGWPTTGGWGDERLPGYEYDMECDVDQYWAHEITSDDIFNKYIARNAPVLIRGLLPNWPALKEWSRQGLMDQFGNLSVSVSAIPYAEKYGGSAAVQMPLGEYIDQVHEHRIVGGRHPWYVFRGHPIPHKDESEDSLVHYPWMPTPELLTEAFTQISSRRGLGSGVSATDHHHRGIFINAQWALGGEGTGAPVHFHNTAWSALVYGAKKWIIYPPAHSIMSNTQILEYFETTMKTMAERGIVGLSCVQTAGDSMIIPEMWGHGVLNLQEAIVVASELKSSHWRMKPPSTMAFKLPTFASTVRKRKSKLTHKAQ